MLEYIIYARLLLLITNMIGLVIHFKYTPKYDIQPYIYGRDERESVIKQNAKINRRICLGFSINISSTILLAMLETLIQIMA